MWPRRYLIGSIVELFDARHATYTGIASVAIHDARETCPRNKLHDLCKQRLAGIHGLPSRVSTPESYTKMRNQDSNRHQIKSACRPRQYWISHVSNCI